MKNDDYATAFYLESIRKSCSSLVRQFVDASELFLSLARLMPISSVIQLVCTHDKNMKKITKVRFSRQNVFFAPLSHQKDVQTNKMFDSVANVTSRD